MAHNSTWSDRYKATMPQVNWYIKLKYWNEPNNRIKQFLIQRFSSLSHGGCQRSTARYHWVTSSNFCQVTCNVALQTHVGGRTKYHHQFKMNVRIKNISAILEQIIPKSIGEQSHDTIIHNYILNKIKGVSRLIVKSIYEMGKKNRRNHMYHLGVVPVVPLLADGTSIHYSG